MVGEAITTALITSGVTLAGTVLSVWGMTKKNEQQLQISQAVTDTKIEALTKEVQKHNNFAERLPVLEEKIRVANHRIDDLEKELKA